MCPTRSVGHLNLRRPDVAVYPHDLGEGVFRLGHNARSSFGAHSYLVVRPGGGNLLVDAPRWTREVYEPIAELGGIADVLLTHRDDVADAERYAQRFEARVWIHQADMDAAPYATNFVAGVDPVRLRSEVVAIPVPGHTEGSVLVLLGSPTRIASSFCQQRVPVRPIVLWARLEPRQPHRRLPSHAPRALRPYAPNTLNRALPGRLGGFEVGSARRVERR